MFKWMLKSLFTFLLFSTVLALNSIAQESIWKSPYFNVVYGKSPTLNGKALKVGDIIKTYDQNGVWCGIDTVRPGRTDPSEIIYGFLIVYGNDPTESGDQGGDEGDTIYFTINGRKTTTNFIWDGSIGPDGDFDIDVFYEISQFKTCCNRRGDINEDGLVDLSDFQALIDYLVNENKLACMETADINGDGIVDIADLMYLGEYLFLDGITPVSCE